MSAERCSSKRKLFNWCLLNCLLLDSAVNVCNLCVCVCVYIKTHWTNVLCSVRRLSYWWALVWETICCCRFLDHFKIHVCHHYRPAQLSSVLWNTKAHEAELTITLPPHTHAYTRQWGWCAVLCFRFLQPRENSFSFFLKNRDEMGADGMNFFDPKTISVVANQLL